MGRQKRLIPKGKFRLVARNPQPNKLYMIYIEYTWNSEPLRKATDIKCKVADWNAKANLGRGELRASYGANYKQVNLLLNKRLDNIDTYLIEYNDKHPNRITKDVIHGILQGQPLTRKDEGKDFIEFATEHLNGEYSRNKIKVSRYHNGLSALNIFRQFLVACGLGTYKPDSIYLGDLTPKLLQEHIDWRRSVKGNQDATINHALTPILKAMQMACSLGLIDAKINALLQDMRIELKPKLDEDDTFDGRYLTKEQIQSLIEYYTTCKEQRRREFIEMFLFAFHACGMRMVDVMTLQWGHINFKENVIRKYQVKTGKRNTIPLTPPAITILRKWHDMGRRQKYVFDLVPDELNINDEQAVYKARNNADRCINQSLCVVSEQLKFPFPLTMHVARHTFAVHALNDGLNMSVVSRLLGHGSTDTTEKVYAKYFRETLADEVAKLHYDYLLPSMKE